MKTYQYAYVSADTLQELRDSLNESGKRGWRCVGFHFLKDNSPNGGSYEAILERELVEEKI